MPSTINQLARILPKTDDAQFNAHYAQLIDTVNSLAGYNGSIPLAAPLDMNGHRLMNLGEAEEDTDALTSGSAAAAYSASALRPQLESSGSTPLKSVRRINDPNQREQGSSFLNDLMSSVPSANSIYPILQNVSGGVQVTLPSSKFTFADQSSIVTNARTDTLSLPTSYTISSISCTGNVVTVVVTATTTLVAGQSITVTGVTPSSFNGTFALTSVVGTTLQYQLSLGTTSGSGGTVQVNGVYYYSAKKRNTNIFLLGPFTSDTAQNRLQVNYDGFQLVAVVVITSSGGVIQQSGGGGSPITASPAAGSFF